MKFEDVLYPTESELREWAKDPEAEFPEEMDQDWDLIVARFSLAPSLIKLSCEDSPNREFFVSCLYILSGNCVRTNVCMDSIKKVEGLFGLVPDNSPADLTLWVNRSIHLFKNPSFYKYPGWGYGDLAYDTND